jgi:hypothetical protein
MIHKQQAYDDLRENALTLLPPRHCMYGVAPGTTPMRGATAAHEDDSGMIMIAKMIGKFTRKIRPTTPEY